MKKLIVIRHGAYGGKDHRLNDLGRDQMSRLAARLQPHLAGATVRMLSSTAPRAVDSATVLAEALKIHPFEQHEVLWSDDEHRQDRKGALKLVREKFEGVDVLIVVTHLEHTQDLPEDFGDQVLDTRLVREELQKGRGRVIDCDTKTDVFLR